MSTTTTTIKPCGCTLGNEDWGCYTCFGVPDHYKPEPIPLTRQYGIGVTVEEEEPDLDLELEEIDIPMIPLTRQYGHAEVCKDVEQVFNAWKQLEQQPVTSLFDIIAEESSVTEDNWTTQISIPDPETSSQTGWKEVKRQECKMTDQTLRCRTCDENFVHTVFQQKKYRKNGWKQPKVCRECSQKRYQQKKN